MCLSLSPCLCLNRGVSRLLSVYQLLCVHSYILLFPSPLVFRLLACNNKRGKRKHRPPELSRAKNQANRWARFIPDWKALSQLWRCSLSARRRGQISVWVWALWVARRLTGSVAPVILLRLLCNPAHSPMPDAEQCSNIYFIFFFIIYSTYIQIYTNYIFLNYMFYRHLLIYA